MARNTMQLGQALSIAILLCELEATEQPGRPEHNEFGKAARALRGLKQGGIYIAPPKREITPPQSQAKNTSKTTA